MTFTDLALAYFCFMKNAVVLYNRTYLRRIMVLYNVRTGVACGKLFNFVAEFVTGELEPLGLWLSMLTLLKCTCI